MITLVENIIGDIKRHAEQDYPHECGGMLVGKFSGDGEKEVFEIFPLENAREDSRHNRVLILPRDVLKAERYAREQSSTWSAITIRIPTLLPFRRNTTSNTPCPFGRTLSLP